MSNTNSNTNKIIISLLLLLFPNGNSLVW